MQKELAMKNLFETTLGTLVQVEHLIDENLDTLGTKVSSKDLQQILKQHKKQTKAQIQNLNKVAELADINLNSPSKPEGILEKGKEVIKNLVSPFMHKNKVNVILEEGTEMLKDYVDTNVGDLAVAFLAKSINYQIIVSYEALIAMSQQMTDEKIFNLLIKCLEQEQETIDALQEFVDGQIEIHAEENGRTLHGIEYEDDEDDFYEEEKGSSRKNHHSSEEKALGHSNSGKKEATHSKAGKSDHKSSSKDQKKSESEQKHAETKSHASPYIAKKDSSHKFSKEEKTHSSKK